MADRLNVTMCIVSLRGNAEKADNGQGLDPCPRSPPSSRVFAQRTAGIVRTLSALSAAMPIGFCAEFAHPDCGASTSDGETLCQYHLLTIAGDPLNRHNTRKVPHSQFAGSCPMRLSRLVPKSIFVAQDILK